MESDYESIVLANMDKDRTYSDKEIKEMQQKSRSKLKTSIIVSILLFPVAIASIVKSSIAVKKADEGNYLEAMKLCDDAQKYIKISIILGIVNYALCIIFLLIVICKYNFFLIYLFIFYYITILSKNQV